MSCFSLHYQQPWPGAAHTHPAHSPVGHGGARLWTPEKNIVRPTASSAAYWGSSVVSEVNLEESFAVQSDSCIKPSLANNEEPQFGCLQEAEQQPQPCLQFALVTEQWQEWGVNSLRGHQHCPPPGFTIESRPI